MDAAPMPDSLFQPRPTHLCLDGQAVGMDHRAHQWRGASQAARSSLLLLLLLALLAAVLPPRQTASLLPAHHPPAHAGAQNRRPGSLAPTPCWSEEGSSAALSHPQQLAQVHDGPGARVHSWQSECTPGGRISIHHFQLPGQPECWLATDKWPGAAGAPGCGSTGSLMPGSGAAGN